MFKKSIAIIFLVLFLPAMVAFSQEPNSAPTQVLITAATTQVAWPPSPMGTTIGPDTPFHIFIQYVYEWGISLGGIAVFIMLVWAGIEYLTSAGDPGKMSSAIKRIQSSVLGLVLLLTSWLILNTINPHLVQLRKLPYLGGNLRMRDIDISRLADTPPPCDFIIVYSDDDFQGTKGTPIMFSKRPQDWETMERVPGGVMERRRIKGDATIKNYGNFPWASANGFTRLTAKEKGLIEDAALNIDRYDENGNLKDNGEYKLGGDCIINFYHTTGGFWGFGANLCGKSLGQSPLPMHSFSVIRQGTQTPTCVEVSRKVPWHIIHEERPIQEDPQLQHPGQREE